MAELTPERIRESLRNLLSYLEGPQFDDSITGEKYVRDKLLEYRLIPHTTKWREGENTWESIHLKYWEWEIVICEESYAERLSDGLVVDCPSL